ncbi:MAG TPA: XRE family transcriptional regulator [Bacteroidales bacterium]|jgi:transcriptional regulator with XRE-family HTH domain|nr:XRE family transcriptional regulator [Bacteroidales bacterium]
MENLAILIGKRIREVRLSKGIRQEDMERLGISYKYFQKVENGRANVTLKTLEKIAEALEIDSTELFELPLAKSKHSAKLASKISEIIKTDDEVMAKKLVLIIDEILR